MEVISFIHLGKLGQYANQLFEIVFVIALCDRYRATLQKPSALITFDRTEYTKPTLLNNK